MNHSILVWSDTHSPFEGFEDEMAAVNACHPALAEHERVTDRLDVIWCQVLVIFAVEEYVGEYAEAVLDPTRSASSQHPRPGWLTKRPLSWDVGRISVHTMFSAAPDKAQKGPSRSRTWNNRTTQRRHHDKSERGRTKHCKSSYACHSEASPARISSSNWAVPL